ncbi:YeeE/YedE thiosulfate transporter family protein [Bradyrhizobium lablabi]|uniref:YeeE/YedE thiosulfate transporter family protein n=1 Tax=Bradyrhizobium lablabi TaxID=722472 RepID=UPI001BAA8DA6|nr:YeeE/YedE thiosulfate transporter family protein [Bradyrhizobium lablabi]MBR0693071.1 YeeE/YedE family protein [Bradyrhizobium lablabi]
MHTGAFLIAFAAAGVMGFANQRGGTCTVAALDEVVVKGTFKRLISLFEASLWAGAGLVLLSATGMLASAPVDYAVGIGTILGGFLFGIGAFVNGACVFGTVARLGSGQLSYLAMPLGFYLGSLAGVHLPAPAQLHGTSPVITASAWLAVPVILLILARLYTHFRSMRQIGRSLSDHIWRPHVATTIIGVTFVVTMAVQPNWTYSEVLSDLASGTASGLLSKIILGIVLLAGAMAGGVTAGRFKVARTGLASAARHLAGGALMGVGGLLIPGGNTGLALAGLPLLWPYAWLAFASMCMTIYIALRLKSCSKRAAAAAREGTLLDGKPG